MPKARVTVEVLPTIVGLCLHTTKIRERNDTKRDFFPINPFTPVNTFLHLLSNFPADNGLCRNYAVTGGDNV